MKKILLLLAMILYVATASSQHIYSIKTSDIADGNFEKYYGTIKVTGNVLNGMKEGSWVENHPNSDIPHFVIYYKEGKKDGVYMEFDKMANLIIMADYKNDMYDGLRCTWTKEGSISAKQEYKEGQLDGQSVVYTDRGFIQEEAVYKAGKREGITIWYSYADKEQGPKYVIYTYKDGLFEGLQETYYEDGRVKSSKMFSNNVANGPAVEYYEDGSIKSECIYKDGEVKGKVKEYKKGERI